MKLRNTFVSTVVVADVGVYAQVVPLTSPPCFVRPKTLTPRRLALRFSARPEFLILKKTEPFV
jgi:hypothetical protein